MRGLGEIIFLASLDIINLSKCFFLFMRFALYIAICVFVIADILMAQELWGLMKSKGFIREGILATPTVMKKR